jgi:hypothetical protein
MPKIRERYPSFAAYAAAGVNEIFGEDFQKTKELQAQWLESTVFLNRGGRFETRILPIEAQFAPAFGVTVGDMDGGGAEDIFLSQNFFAVQPETARYDAGRGLWLRGDGKGGFQTVSGLESGILVYGEQRGCALGDYDADGRVDLVVGQNAGATKLFRNQTGKPGLRIRLKGGDENFSGIGAVIRLKFDGRLGPAREIHAGSGYWSQDSAVTVLAIPDGPSQVSVRWPGGRTTLADIPPGSREIVIQQPAAKQ